MISALSNSQGQGRINIDINAEDDDGPFLAITLTDDNTGAEIADLIIEDAGEVKQLLEEVVAAAEKFEELEKQK